LNNLLLAYEDKTAYAQCIFAFSSGPEDDNPKVFIGRTEGRIVPARGPTDFGWDPVFQPDGFDLTYAEMDRVTKNAISHRYRSLEQLKSYLKANAGSFASQIS
jgi:inosine triphosphate pyrophosphatase